MPIREPFGCANVSGPQGRPAACWNHSISKTQYASWREPLQRFYQPLPAAFASPFASTDVWYAGRRKVATDVCLRPQVDERTAVDYADAASDTPSTSQTASSRPSKHSQDQPAPTRQQQHPSGAAIRACQGPSAARRPCRPPLDTGLRKRPPPAQLSALMHQMLKLLDAEYHTINSHNLGVQSGTAVIDNLIVRRLHALCGQVHMLMVLHDDCSDAMAAFCSALRPSQLNRLQVRASCVHFRAQPAISISAILKVPAW